MYVVRHGETQEDRDGTVQDQLATELNAVGLERARLQWPQTHQRKSALQHSSGLKLAVQVRSFQEFLNGRVKVLLVTSLRHSLIDHGSYPGEASRCGTADPRLLRPCHAEPRLAALPSFCSTWAARRT